jgi:hypothetical protein
MSNQFISRTIGYDSFITDVNKHQEMHCKVCGMLMEVNRNMAAIKGFVAAMSGTTKPYDIFNCPISDEDWHKQIIKLMIEQQQTSSATIANLLQAEIDMIKVTKKRTK